MSRKKTSFYEKATKYSQAIHSVVSPLYDETLKKAQVLRQSVEDSDTIFEMARDLEVEILKLGEKLQVLEGKEKESGSLLLSLIQDSATMATLFQMDPDLMKHTLATDEQGMYEMLNVIEQKYLVLALKRLPEDKLTEVVQAVRATLESKR